MESLSGALFHLCCAARYVLAANLGDVVYAVVDANSDVDSCTSSVCHDLPR